MGKSACLHAGLVLLACLPVAPVLAADDFESFRKQQQEDVRQQQEEFRQYKEQQDADFADFLKTRWREYDINRGALRIKEPKPRVVPSVAPALPAQPALKPQSPVPPAVQPPAPPVFVPLASPRPLSQELIEVNFYGNPVVVPIDLKWKAYRLGNGAKPETMSAFWSAMSGSRYEPALKAIDETRHTLKLDDWAHVTLWRSVAQALQPERRSEQNLLLWFFLIKSGYDVRLGYAGNDVHLFIAVGQQVYATRYTSVGKQPYYAVLEADRGDSIRSFYTYEANYPNKLKPLDISAASVSFTHETPAQRSLAFDYQGQTIRLNASYDRKLVEYTSSFPQTEFPLYFDTSGSQELRATLLPSLRKYTDKMNDEEAVNFLLAFVQNAFAYKTDEEQFGYEKYFFVEESLYYPYNDCEDRSVLFAWLVQELRGLPVIGLLYPGHMTTAVEFKPLRPAYATLDYRGKTYIITDPTYIGATAGMAMASYAKLQPTRVVDIRH